MSLVKKSLRSLITKKMVTIVLWDFITDKESPLSTVHALLRQVLSTHSSICMLDETTKHKGLEIEQDCLTVQKVQQIGYCSAVFTTLPLIRSSEITFQCVKLANWVAVGVADRDTLRNTRIPNGLEGSHAWLVSTAGYIWYPTCSKHHNTQNAFQFDRTGEKLMHMIYDSVNNELTFRSGTEEFVMKDVPSGLYPMIMLYDFGDSARIITNHTFIMHKKSKKQSQTGTKKKLKSKCNLMQ
jgi:hypothetical protein